MAQGAAGVPVRSKMAPGSRFHGESLAFSGPATIFSNALPNPHFPIPMDPMEPMDFAMSVLLCQGNVSHSQEMINSLCSSVLASDPLSALRSL